MIRPTWVLWFESRDNGRWLAHAKSAKDALLRRATAGRSSGEEQSSRLELDAEWVGEE